MDFLMLYIDEEGSRFDRHKVREAMLQSSGFRGLEERDGTGWVLQGHLDFGDDSAIVRLVDGEESISISGTGPASLKAAVEIQAGMPIPLRLLDSDYSFDLPISGILKIDELQVAIDRARAENEQASDE